MCSVYVHKSHNVSILLYHFVFPAKYRRAVLDVRVDEQVRDTCLEIEKRNEVKFLEIGSDSDHIHLGWFSQSRRTALLSWLG